MDMCILHLSLNIEPISPRLKNNRDAHEAYIENTIEYTDTLLGFVEHARTQYPSKPLLEYTCMFTKHVHELLVYASQTCLNSPKPSEKLVAVTLINKYKRVRFVEPVTSSNNIPKQTDSLKTKDSNKPFNALVKHSMRNAKFEPMCAIYDKCLFDANHDMCLIDFVNDVDVRSKSKSKRNKKSKAWKLTGKVFTDVGYKWNPTGRFFTIVGNSCPLTRITPKKIVHLKETTPKSADTPKPEIKVYSRRPKQLRSVSSSKKDKIVESKIANNSEPTHLWGSNATNVPSSSSLVNDRFSRSSSACALGKSKKSSHQPKAEDTNQEKLYLLHMDLCGPMRVESINGKKFILVIVNDYSRFTWVKFLRSKDEAPDDIIKCIKNIQVRLNATVRNVRTNNGTEFVNQTLCDFFENLMHDQKPDLSFFHVFSSLCYPTNDSEVLGKLNEKAYIGIFVGYTPIKKAFRIYNRRTQKIMETIHVTFDELTAMASEQFGSGPGLQVMTLATSSSGLVPNIIPQQPCNPPKRDD
ncbi:retrovirus-related pol polyprotein from transposon TNT 1-94 [Tanacetum coccineum]